MKVLDLFSGIGGFSLGLQRAGMETVAFCEIDPFCCEVLKKHWPDVPIYDDIRELSGETIGHVDLICGGYPCQPFSTAGKRRGKEDDRHLWPEFMRLVREIRPSWVIGENVAGHITMGLDQVLSDLEGEGYAWDAFVIPACAVNAPHRRDRVWILAANPEYVRGPKQECEHERTEVADRGGEDRLDAREDVADNSGDRCSERRKSISETWSDGFIGNIGWESEPDMGRMAHGVPRRVDRLRALGNAVVPQIPEIIGRAILNDSL